VAIGQHPPELTLDPRRSQAQSQRRDTGDPVLQHGVPVALRLEAVVMDPALERAFNLEIDESRIGLHVPVLGDPPHAEWAGRDPEREPGPVGEGRWAFQHRDLAPRRRQALERAPSGLGVPSPRMVRGDRQECAAFDDQLVAHDAGPSTGPGGSG
jgi:hypothetical protein